MVSGGVGVGGATCPDSSISDIPLKWLPLGQMHCLEINPIPSQMLSWGEVTQPPPSPFLLQRNRIQIPLVSVSNSSSRVPQMTSLLWPVLQRLLLELGSGLVFISLPFPGWGHPRTCDMFSSGKVLACAAKSMTTEGQLSGFQSWLDHPEHVT